MIWKACDLEARIAQLPTAEIIWNSIFIHQFSFAKVLTRNGHRHVLIPFVLFVLIAILFSFVFMSDSIHKQCMWTERIVRFITHKNSKSLIPFDFGICICIDAIRGKTSETILASTLLKLTWKKNTSEKFKAKKRKAKTFHAFAKCVIRSNWKHLVLCLLCLIYGESWMYIYVCLWSVYAPFFLTSSDVRKQHEHEPLEMWRLIRNSTFLMAVVRSLAIFFPQHSSK